MGFTEFGNEKHEVTQIRSTLHFASKYRASIIVLAVAHANRGFTASPLSTAAFPLTHLRQRKGKCGRPTPRNLAGILTVRLCRIGSLADSHRWTRTC
jgi:hypothetical protein